MEEQSQLMQFLETLLHQLPSLVTIIVCIVSALIRWRRHPRISLVLVGALTWMLINILAFTVIYVFLLPDWSLRAGQLLRFNFQALYLTVGFLYNTALTVGLGLLLIAIFMQRRIPVSFPPRPALS